MPPLVTEVCCFEGDHYQWFKLPVAMEKPAAEAWALANIGTPAEKFRYLDRNSVI